MSQTYQSRTPNYSDRKTAAILPMPLTLTGAQARALWEMSTLVTYSDGFTWTPEMAAVCELIADSAGSATDRAFCLARADERERAATRGHPSRRAVYGPARKHAA
jgi:hypothetical protein